MLACAVMLNYENLALWDWDVVGRDFWTYLSANAGLDNLLFIFSSAPTFQTPANDLKGYPRAFFETPTTFPFSKLFNSCLGCWSWTSGIVSLMSLLKESNFFLCNGKTLACLVLSFAPGLNFWHLCFWHLKTFHFFNSGWVAGFEFLELNVLNCVIFCTSVFLSAIGNRKAFLKSSEFGIFGSGMLSVESWVCLSAATRCTDLLDFLFLHAHPPNIRIWQKGQWPRNLFSTPASLSLVN